jgi:hypothetical protein
MDEETFILGEFSAALILAPNTPSLFPSFLIDVKVYVPHDQERKVPDHVLALTELAHMISQDHSLVTALAQRAVARRKGYYVPAAAKTLSLEHDKPKEEPEYESNFDRWKANLWD